jgi:hypothetical protein
MIIEKEISIHYKPEGLTLLFILANLYTIQPPFLSFNKIYYRWLKPTAKDSKAIRKNFKEEKCRRHDMIIEKENSFYYKPEGLTLLFILANLYTIQPPFLSFNKIYYRWLKPTAKDSKAIRKNFKEEKCRRHDMVIEKENSFYYKPDPDLISVRIF